jgi:hypothetical protein
MQYVGHSAVFFSAAGICFVYGYAIGMIMK